MDTEQVEARSANAHALALAERKAPPPLKEGASSNVCKNVSAKCPSSIFVIIAVLIIVVSRSLFSPAVLARSTHTARVQRRCARS